MSPDNWKKVYESKQLYMAEIIKAILEENAIECVVMNRQDSAYGFGEVEVYTPNENVLRALHIIGKCEL